MTQDKISVIRLEVVCSHTAMYAALFHYCLLYDRKVLYRRRQKGDNICVPLR